jgi:hypothetical protein
MLTYSTAAVAYAQDSNQNLLVEELIAKQNRMFKAHGIVMGIAFVLLLPIGAIIVRIFSFPGLVWVHAGTQVTAYMMAIAGLGMGIWNAQQRDYLKQQHPIIGMIVVAGLFFQPFLGLGHHYSYKRSLPLPNIFTYLHIWWGRALITLAMVNGGLGLQLAVNASMTQIKAYGAVAGIMWVIWMATVLMASVKRRTTSHEKKETGEKVGRVDSVDGSDREHMRAHGDASHGGGT